MRIHLILLLVPLMLFMFSLALAGDSIDESDINQSILDEEYPHNIDTLEEFIQSYYLLLDSDEYLRKYNFLNLKANVIQNDSLALAGFYNRLVALRSGLVDRVSIYQIGDSHIQSGYFAGTARSALQKHFGNAGRGLSFPYRFAGTNQPDDYRISSGKIWSRNLKNTGMAGYTVSCKNSGSMTIRTNDFFGTENKHDLIKLITDNAACVWSANDIRAETGSESGLFIHSLNLPQMGSVTELQFSNPNSIETDLYGILLERNEPGILYHSTGVNGASFDNLEPNHLLFSQIKALKPDLIIISLGTNDSQGTYRAEMFRAQMQKFVNRMRTENPDTPILFTLPPDTFKRGVINQDVYKAGMELKNYALANGYAIWDLAEVMGGKGSVRLWKAQALAANDMIHFSPKGYMLQGYLIYQALIRGYKKFAETPR